MLKKTLLFAGLLALLITPFVFADVDPEGADPVAENIKAVESVKAGAYYQIYTYSDGNTTTATKYYLKTDGYLTNDPAQAGLFPLKMVNRTINCEYGDIDVTAFKFDARFTNPTLSDGQLVANGHINIADPKNNRDDFEAQVFFLGKSGNYAIRSTAANSESWGANTFWTATDYDADGMPEAEYSLTPAYIWKLVDATDVGIRNDLKDAIANATNTVKNREGVGEALFMKSDADLQTLAAAVAAAQTVADNADATPEELQAALDALNQAAAAFAAAGNQPEAGKAYYIQQKESGFYLALDAANDAVILSETPMELKWVAAENGGWYITDGESYVGIAGTNAWTMSTAADKKTAISPAPVSRMGAIYYTLNEANGVIASDDVAAGSKCYADKSLSGSADKALWTIVKNDPAEILAEEVTKARAAIGETGGLFQHTNEAAAELEKSIADAEKAAADPNATSATLNAAIAALQAAVEAYANSAVAKPAADKAYTIKLNTTELYMNISNGATIEAEPTRFVFVPADQSDRYYLKDETENLYVAMEGSNAWTMTNAPDKKVSMAFEYAEGAYHIQTENAAPKCYIGVDDYTAGSKFYADKAKGKDTWIIEEAPAITEKALVLNYERTEGQGYTADQCTVDFVEAIQFLGVEALSTDMLRIVNPDGTLISDYAPFDGWFDGDGIATKWGDNTKVCVKFFQAIPDGKFEICDMNNADEVGKTYSVTWALVANEKTVTYTINITFVAKPVIDLTLADLKKLSTIDIDFESECGKSYEGMKQDVNLESVLTSLGVSSLDDVTIYAVMPDGSLDVNYKVGTTDGWRDADGNWKAWTGDLSTAPYFYVKANFSLASGQLYEVGAYPGHTDEPITYTATYAFVKTGSTDAVIMNVNLKYTLDDGIDGIHAEHQRTEVYDLAGRRVQKAQKGIYITNGRKVAVK